MPACRTCIMERVQPLYRSPSAPINFWVLAAIRLFSNAVISILHTRRERSDEQEIQVHGRQQRRRVREPTHSLRSRASTRSPPRAPWPTTSTSGPRKGQKNIFGTDRQGLRDGVRGRRRRHRARLTGHRRSDHHLHCVPGPAAHDPQHVQDRRRAAAGRLPRERPHRRDPIAQHLRRPLRRHGLPSDRLCDARRGQRRRRSWTFRAVAHLAAIKGRMPFINFFDGFRTSHEIQKVAVWDYDDLAEHVRHGRRPAPSATHAINPETPAMRGSHENGDIFFQNREACNSHYDALPAVVEEYMDKVNAKLGTDYKLFNYYGAPDADRVIVCMGSLCRRRRGGHRLPQRPRREGRPGQGPLVPPVREARSSPRRFPPTVKKIAVMDRTKEPGSLGEPLYLDVVTALAELGMLSDLKVVGGRYGLGSKDTPPSSVFAIYKELEKDEPAREFTIGIVDDVTRLSLPEDPDTPQHRSPRHHRVQVLGSGRRRHRRREQELHQDHRRPHRQVRAGLLPVRLQEDRRRDHQPPALRRLAHPQPLLHQQGRLRRLPQPVLHHEGLPNRARRQAAAACS